MVAGVGGLATGGISLWILTARQRREDSEREKPPRLWIRDAIVTTSAIPGDPRPFGRCLEVVRIRVAYIGGGRPFTVFDASLGMEGDFFRLGRLMAASHHVPAGLGGDFLIEHGQAGQGLGVDAPNHKVFTVRLSCGGGDFYDLTFMPTLLPDPDGRLVYMEPEHRTA